MGHLTGSSRERSHNGINFQSLTGHTESDWSRDFLFEIFETLETYNKIIGQRKRPLTRSYNSISRTI